MTLSTLSGGHSGGMKTNRFGKATAGLEEDRKVNKVRIENQLLNEKLKAINYQIDEFVKDQISLSKSISMLDNRV